MTPRELAWNDIHDLLPDGWRVGPTPFDPGRHGWSVTAVSPRYSGRLRPPSAVVGHGDDEVAALTDLAIRLRELRDVERRMASDERARAAYLHGAEEQPRSTLGRPLTPDELERVVRRFSAAGADGGSQKSPSDPA